MMGLQGFGNAFILGMDGSDGWFQSLGDGGGRHGLVRGEDFGKRHTGVLGVLGRVLSDRRRVLVHVVFITFVDFAWLRMAMVPCGLVPEALALRDKDT